MTDQIEATSATSTSPAPTSPATKPEAVLAEPAAIRRTDRPARRGGGLGRFFSFIGWLFTGFGLIPALLKRGGHARRQEITVYSAHRAFCLWALILTGFIGAAIVWKWPPPTYKVAHVLGWIYIWVLLYTFLTLVFDLGTLKLLLWAGIFTLLWFVFKYWEAMGHAPVLRNVAGYFKGLNPQLDAGLATVISWLLLVPWVGSLFLTFTNGRKKFTPNEISEFEVGEGSELTDRSGLKFRTRYRDVLESILGFGAGDLVAYDNQHNVVKKWENVLFLIFLWPRLDDILHERSALVENAPEDPVEIEAVHRRPAKVE